MTTILPTTVPALRLRKVMGRADWHAPREFGPDGWKMLHTNGTSSVIVTAARLDGTCFYHRGGVGRSVDRASPLG